MFENIYLIALLAVIAVGVFWLAMKWIKEPREGRWPNRRR